MAAVIFNKTQILRSLNQGPICIAIIRDKKYSTGTETKAYNLSQLKRGTGGRSSFSGIVATVFGGTGFVGRYVCNRLGKIGSQIIIPYRGEAYDIRHLKLCGDLGQVLFCPFHLQDEVAIEKAMKYSNVVINMVGREWETKRFKFHDVNVTGAATIARIAKKCGVERFIHFSHLNASPDPKPCVLSKPSKFLISKFEGEQAVLNEFPEATIFRPADIYGQEDRFLRHYAQDWRRHANAMPLWHKGEKTIKQPVYVGDVAGAVINAIREPDTAGKIYQAVGPKRYYLSDLLDYMYRVMRKDDKPSGYFRYDLRYDPTFHMKVIGTNLISPSWPLCNLHYEKLELEHQTDVLQKGVPTLEDLGIQLTQLENQAPWELRPYTEGLYHGHAADEPFPRASPPKTANA